MSPSRCSATSAGVRRFPGQLRRCAVSKTTRACAKLAATPGDGRVLVVDGQGSLKHALLGDQIAAQAVANGWAGVLIHGCVRDVEILATLPLGVLALGACPRRTERRDLGEVEVPVNFAGVAFVPGHWLYADANGVLVAALPLSLDSAGGPI